MLENILPTHLIPGSQSDFGSLSSSNEDREPKFVAAVRPSASAAAVRWRCMQARREKKKDAAAGDGRTNAVRKKCHTLI